MEPLCLRPRPENYRCPVNWLPVSGKCYRIFSERKTWDDAERSCRRFQPGCHLASIHSRADSDDLAEYIKDFMVFADHVWIGLRDPNKDYNWEWTDKSKTNYLPWKQNQPDHWNNKEFCVEIVHNSGFRWWNDRDCSDPRPFLCQCPY